MRIATATNKLLDANKLKLVEYLSLPKACRPMPLKAFAKQVLGVSEPTVHSWKKDQEVVSSVKKNIVNRFANDIPDVLMALRDNAIAGDPKAARLFLEYVDGGVEDVEMPRIEKSKEEVINTIKDLTDKFYPEKSEFNNTPKSNV